MQKAMDFGPRAPARVSSRCDLSHTTQRPGLGPCTIVRSVPASWDPTRVGVAAKGGNLLIKVLPLAAYQKPILHCESVLTIILRTPLKPCSPYSCTLGLAVELHFIDITFVDRTCRGTGTRYNQTLKQLAYPQSFERNTHLDGERRIYIYRKKWQTIQIMLICRSSTVQKP